jgi:cysteinyl-tRNA synthetase
MIELVKTLLEKGYAYEVDGNIYFEVDKFRDYGKLSPVDIKKQKPGARVKIDKKKKKPYDFALWLKAPPSHIMKWPSPWGVGYPGWHIECSVMSMKYLGETLDIHGGGYDHLFLHHPNEIAQSEAATGKKFVNYWMHAAFLTVGGEKMSKSKGNFITARELINKYGGETIRLFVASSHYRKPVDYNEKVMEQAQEQLQRLYDVLYEIEDAKGGDKTALKKITQKMRKDFEEAMDDDFNTPLALKTLLAYVRDVNKNLDSEKALLEEAKKTIQEFGRILGLRLDITAKRGVESRPLVDLLLDVREELRKQKNYGLSDKIRKRMEELGIRVEDTEAGAKIKK